MSSLLLTPPLRPIEALRRDAPALGDSGPPQLARWVQLARVLALQPHAGRRLDVATVEAALVAAEDGRAIRPALDPCEATVPRERLIQRVRGVVERMEDQGALWLGDTILAGLSELSESHLDYGRIEAQRARISWKRGLTGEAAVRYERVGALGRRAELRELVARAWIGHATLAHMREDQAVFARAAARALRESEAAGVAPLVALSHHQLLVVASLQHRWSRALVHGWAAYVAAPHDPIIQADRLLNVAEVLRKAGRVDAARAGLLAALELTPPDRIRLPALGALAQVEAMRGARAAVRAAEMEIRELTARERLPYQVADALADLAAAYSVLGDAARVDAIEQEARRRASEHGFTPVLARLDAAHRAVPSGTAHTRPRLTPDAESVVAAVRALAA